MDTPYYFYDLGLLRRTLEAVRSEADAFNFRVHYALKANSNPKLLSIIRAYNLGADCVSGNEIARALEVGFAPPDIVFAGVGKTDAEIAYGLNHDIFCFNCESLQELEVIDAIAASRGKCANVALRINPNIDAETHHHITTGLNDNKFGIGIGDLGEACDLARRLTHIKMNAIHLHVGSQITNFSVFSDLCVRVNELQRFFEQQNIVLEHINLGGGLGIDYLEPDTHAIADFKGYFSLFDKALERRKNQQIHFELGRSIVAQCGSLMSRVLYVKKTQATEFVVIDAGMTELLRPALYQAVHLIENISKVGEANERKYNIVGPICESSDCFGKDVSLPKTERGDLIAIRSTGAYGETMASEYNLRSKAKAFYSPEP